MKMDIKNRQLSKSIIASTAIIFSLGMGVVGSTASAHEGGYASGGNGNVLRDGNGNCIRATYGNAYPECEPAVARAQSISKPPAPVIVVPKPVVVAVVEPKPVVITKPKPVYITKTLSLNEAAGANFGFDKDNLSNKAQVQLATFANEVKRSNIAPSSVSVVGHTDSTGPKNYNQTLSEKRANSVASYLAGQGIDRAKMQVSGRGESQPVASNKSRTGRAENRRVDIRVLGQRTISVKQ